MARVVGLFQAFVHRQPMREAEEVEAVENRGLKGCIHGRPGSRRQILLMDAETLVALGLAPGMVKENITTEGLALSELKEGQQLRVGQATLEVTDPCHPCHLMEQIRPGLREELRGRRGMLCRVIGAGRIRRGDAIALLDFAQVAN